MTEADEAIKQFTEKYAAVKQAHPDIPSLDEINNEWEILELVGREKHFPQNVLRYTRWHLMNALNGWGNYLHGFILPNQQSAVSMEEYNYFSDEEKKSVIEVMNWIMYRARESHTLQLDEDDSKTATFLAAVWKEWQAHKPKLRDTIRKNADIWKGKLTT